MRCNRVDDLLPAYLDGDLGSRINEQVSAHLDACERCRQAQAEQQRALRFLEGARYVPSIDLWAEFSRRLEQERRSQPSPWQFLWQPGLAGALAAAVVSLVALTASDRRPAERWMPAPPGTVQMARVPESSRLQTEPAAPRSALPETRASSPRQSASVTFRLAAASPSQTPAKAPFTQRRSARRTWRRAGQVLLAKSSLPTLTQRLPRENRTEREQERSTFRLAALSSEAPISGLEPDALPSPGADAGTAGPLDAAEALMSVQQDAASDQMRNELLLMARGVARVSGELSSYPISGDGAGT